MREELIQKLEKYAQIINGINETAQSVIPVETKTKLLSVNKTTTELLDRLKKNSFEIAIVGLEKAGKSTFANALIGLDILPTKEERCTYTSSCVKYSNKTYAEVEFFSLQEFNNRFESNIKSLGVSLDCYDYGKVTLKDIQIQTSDLNLSPEKSNILEDITDMIKSEAEIMFWLGKPVQIFSENDMSGSEFKNLVQNPDRVDGRYVAKPAFAVKRITVYSDKLNDMSNCIIYDVPGFDSPTAIHMEQTKERMNNADAVILIANASKPSLTGPQVSIFKTSIDSDGVPFNEKIFVFANRADESRDLQYNIGVLKDDLNKYSILRNVNSDRLVAGSAFAYLCKLNEAQDDISQQAILNLQSNGISDGIEEIKQKLQQYNDVVRVKVMEKRIANLEKKILEISEDIKMSCGNISLTNGSNVELLKAYDTVKNVFSDKLYSYRNKIRSILREKPLTSSILNALKEELKPESLYPSDSEISSKMNEATQGVVEFETLLRKDKRSEVSKKFDNITLGISEDLKREIVDEIIELLLESLNVTSGHLYFEDIKSMSKEYIETYFNDFNFDIILRALTLRFSDEVFEILINKPFLMPDRIEYFQNNIENIVSLALYGQNVRDAIKNESKIDAADLPMINSILFHEGIEPVVSHNDNISDEDRQRYISDLEGAIRPKLYNDCPELGIISEQTVDWCIANSIDIRSFIQTLNGLMPDIKKEKYDKTKECDAIKHYLNVTSEQLEANSGSENNNEEMLLSDRYFEASKSRINTHEWVIKSFKEDIGILVNIVSGPVVNAIQLEVPFVANMTAIIDKIRLDVVENKSQGDEYKSTPFMYFYDKVYPKSEYLRVEENEAIQQINGEKQSILDGVNSLLQELE